jgi:hypothetical protein
VLAVPKCLCVSGSLRRAARAVAAGAAGEPAWAQASFAHLDDPHWPIITQARAQGAFSASPQGRLQCSPALDPAEVHVHQHSPGSSPCTAGTGGFLAGMCCFRSAEPALTPGGRDSQPL